MFTRPPTRAQQLASEIEQSIIERNLQSGDRIANMDELKEQSGYARSTIGETARLLAERGTVDVRPGRGGGLFVATTNPVVHLRRTLLLVPQGSPPVADAIAVREALEELIALDATRHRARQDIADLRVEMKNMKAHSDDWAAFMVANWSLHERIADITHNDLARGVYVGTIRCVAELSVRPDAEAVDADKYLNLRVKVHQQLVDAIISGDQDRTREAVGAHRGIAVGSDGDRPADHA